jgi:hypothetical protein
MPVGMSVVSPTLTAPKLNTHTVSSPSTAIPQGRVMPPPVKGEPGCGVRSAARNIVTDGLRAVPIIARVGHGESSQSELDTQMFPWLSAAFPTG